MKKLLKIGLWLFVGIFILLLLASILFSTLFKEDLKALLLKEINKQLKTELVIKGESKVSLFEFFPNASFAFQDIFIKDALRPGENLVEAESLTFLFNIQDAFSSQYNFQELVIQNGAINIFINEKGQTNYDIFKEDASNSKKKETAETPTSIQLNKAEFENVHFVYHDAQSNMKTGLQVASVNLGSLDYKGDKMVMQVKGDGLLKAYEIDDLPYLVDQKLKIDLELSSDTEQGLYDFKEAKVSLGENDFSINGWVKTLKEGYDLDVDFKGIKLSLDEFLLLLPKEAGEPIADWKIEGDFDFAAQMKGKYKEHYYPNIQADFSFDDGTITPKSLGYPLKKFNCNAHFTNGVLNHANTSLFTLENLDFNLLGNPFHFDGEISNLQDARIKGNANGKLDLYAFKEYAEKQLEINSLEGEIDFKDWSFDGKWTDFKSSQNYPQSQGEVLLDKLSFKYNDGQVKEINGAIKANGKDWYCETLACRFPKSEASLSGEIRDFSPFLLQLSDSLIKDQIVPQFDLEFTASELQLTDFQDFRPEQADSLTVIANEEESEEGEKLPQINGTLTLEIGEVKTEKTTVKNITGSLCLNGPTYRIHDLTFDVFEGRGLLSGLIEPIGEKEHKFKGNLKFGNLDLREMLQEMDDFEQDYLSYKNIEGILNLNVLMETRLDEHFYAKKNELEAWADVELLEAKLLNYKPIMEMTEFEDQKRLKQISFQPVRNQFVIKNRSVKIPKMEINSNLVKIDFSGRHNLNNTIHYYFKVDLLDYFGKRFFNKNAKDAVEKNKKGGLNYYFSLFNEASNPDFKKGNKKMVLQQFRKDAVFNPVNINRKVTDNYSVLWQCE